MTFFVELVLLAAAVVVLLVPMRIIRMRAGRTPFPEGWARYASILALVVVPPLVLHALTPRDVTGGLASVIWIPVFALLIGAMALVMLLIASVLERVVPVRRRRMLLLALVGNEGDPYRVVDPPMTPGLIDRMRTVTRANAAFPRGHTFPESVDAAGYRASWDELDLATTSLEQEIASETRLGDGVAQAATEVAADARNRLQTLRRLEETPSPGAVPPTQALVRA